MSCYIKHQEGENTPNHQNKQLYIVKGTFLKKRNIFMILAIENHALSKKNEFLDKNVIATNFQSGSFLAH